MVDYIQFLIIINFEPYNSKFKLKTHSKSEDGLDSKPMSYIPPAHVSIHPLCFWVLPFLRSLSPSSLFDSPIPRQTLKPPPIGFRFVFYSL